MPVEYLGKPFPLYLTPSELKAVENAMPVPDDPKVRPISRNSFLRVLIVLGLGAKEE